MHIDRVELTHVRIPLVEPFRISNGEVAAKDAIVITLSADGLTAYGESSPMAGSFYSADTPESCWEELTSRLAPALAGRTFANLDAACEWIGARPASNFAKAGIETAFWDLAAQRRGLPLHRLLGATRDRAPSGLAVGLYDSTDGLLRAIARYLPDGYQRLKIKICPGHDIDLVRAVRREFPSVPLMVDANAAYSLSDLRVFQELDELGLLMYEQPLGAGMLRESAVLQAAVKTPVCLDESIESLEDLERAAALASCRIVNIKIQRVGGFHNALRLYHRARELGLSVWVGTMPELGIGQAQGAALAALPDCDYPTDVESSARWFTDDLIYPLLEVRQGWIGMPTSPGLGYAVDSSKIERFRVSPSFICNSPPATAIR